MIDDATQELASLHAFDLLEGAELAAFGAALAREPELRDLARGLRECAAQLSFTAPAALPPPSLRARLLAKIGESGSAPARSNVVPFRPSALIPWAAAAGFAIATAWLGQDLFSTREEVAVLQTEARLTEIARQEALNQLKAERITLGRQAADISRQFAEASQRATGLGERVADLRRRLKAQGDLAQFRIATLTSMLGNSPQALAVAVWNPAIQEGVFTVDKLPTAAAGQDYELWVIDPDQPKPVSGGVFTVGADGQARVQFRTEAPVGRIAKFAVSRERKGGAPHHGGPQGQVIMLSQ